MADDGPSKPSEFRAARIGLAFLLAGTASIVWLTQPALNPIIFIAALFFAGGMVAVDLKALIPK